MVQFESLAIANLPATSVGRKSTLPQPPPTFDQSPHRHRQHRRLRHRRKNSFARMESRRLKKRRWVCATSPRQPDVIKLNKWKTTSRLRSKCESTSRLSARNSNRFSTSAGNCFECHRQIRALSAGRIWAKKEGNPFGSPNRNCEKLRYLSAFQRRKSSPILTAFNPD